MLTKKDAVIGKRVQWRPSDTTKHLCLGTIRDIKPDGEVIIEYDDGAISSTYVDLDFASFLRRKYPWHKPFGFY